LTPGDRLFKEMLSEEEEEDGGELDEIFVHGERKKFKAFTLCMICNPAACGHDHAFNTYKASARNGQEKSKKIAVNSSAYNNALKTVDKDENQMPLVGKIVFIKESDIEHNEFEEGMCRWMTSFHRRLSKYCIKKPRYSELRPMRFSLF
jgi:hypothetical protein